MELLDYLAWRNDVPLSVSPFNEVDNVIFSYLSYIEFGKLLEEKGDGFFDLKEQYEHFCEKHSMEEIKSAGQFTERAPLLLQKMMEGARFQALLSQMQTGSHAAISQVMGKTKEEGEKV